MPYPRDGALPTDPAADETTGPATPVPHGPLLRHLTLHLGIVAIVAAMLISVVARSAIVGFVVVVGALAATVAEIRIHNPRPTQDGMK